MTPDAVLAFGTRRSQSAPEHQELAFRISRGTKAAGVRMDVAPDHLAGLGIECVKLSAAPRHEDLAIGHHNASLAYSPDSCAPSDAQRRFQLGVGRDETEPHVATS